MKRAILYTRVDLGMEQHDLERQERELKEYCKEHGIEIDRIFSEIDYMGWMFRGKFLFALDYIQKYERVQYFLVVDRERISKHEPNYAKAESILNGFNVRVIVTNEAK